MHKNLILLFQAALLIGSITLCNAQSRGNSGRVTIEDQPASEKELRRQAVQKKINALTQKLNQAAEKYRSETRHLNQMNTTGAGLSTKADYNNKIKENFYLLSKMEKYKLKSLESDLNRLVEERAKITNTPYTPSTTYQYQSNKINQRIKKLEGNLSLLAKSEGEELADNLNQAKALEDLDKELSQLDLELSQNKVSPNSKKTLKSLDEMLEEGNSPSSGGGLEGILDDLDSDQENNTILDDLVNPNESQSAKANFEIVRRNNLTGVVDSNGKVLIPFKKWGIQEYKSGIAKVSQRVDEYKFSCGSFLIYKSGYVDASGKFLDAVYTFENCLFCNAKDMSLTLTVGYSYDYNLSPEQNAAKRAAYDRRVKLRREREAREREIKDKQCKIEQNKALNYLNSKYNN